MVNLLVLHAYINEMLVEEAKSPVKNLVIQRCAEGFSSGVKWLSRQGMNVADPVPSGVHYCHYPRLSARLTNSIVEYRL
jgi:hypothetical protein